ncbi:MAG: glycosyltransferase family 61 protein [Opitutaceae bacterium]
MKLLRQARIRTLETAEKFTVRHPARRRRAGIPRVIETSTARWHRANRAELDAQGIRFTPLTDASEHHTPLPACPNGQPPSDWDWAVRWKPRERFYAEIPNGRLVFEPWRCASAVLAPSGALLHDALPIFFHTAASHPVRNSVCLGEPVRLKGRAFLLLNDANSNFYHWMCDILPRLHVAQLAGQRLDSFDWFITDAISQGFQKETLAAFGIPPEKVFIGTAHRHVAADVLCVTSLNDRSGMVHRESLSFVRDSVLRHCGIPAEIEATRRVFISRQKVYARKIDNWEAIEPILHEFGFEIIESERLNLCDQARLFREARHVIAGHGAGLTNLMYCMPGTKVLEILHDGWGHPMYWLMSAKMELDYTLLKAGAAGRHGVEMDHMLVDPAPLRAYLQAIYGG